MSKCECSLHRCPDSRCHTGHFLVVFLGTPASSGMGSLRNGGSRQPLPLNPQIFRHFHRQQARLSRKRPFAFILKCVFMGGGK